MHVYKRAGESAPGLPEREKRLFLVELSLHGAAGCKERQYCLWTGFHCAGLHDMGREEAASWGGSGHTWLHN